jgi:hypothetical protein
MPKLTVTLSDERRLELIAIREMANMQQESAD